MKILSRYVLREFLVPLGYCLAGFVSLFVLFELFGSFSRLVEAKLPAGEAVRYFLGFLSPYFQWIAPAALMLATLYTMWTFCRHSEIVAMRSGGVSFLVISRPILLVAFAMAAFVAWVNECYVPLHAQRAARLRAERFDLKRLERSAEVVYRNARANRVWSADRAGDETFKALIGVKVIEDRPDGARILSVTAPRADYMDGEWWFTNPKVLHYDEAGRETATTTPELDSLGTRVFPQFRERPRDIAVQNRSRAHNSVRDRLRFLRTHGDLAEDQRREYLYDAWAQALAPLACLVITLFAIPAGMATGRQSVFRGVLGALITFFSFYGASLACMAGAYKGLIAPIPAAILPHAAFLALGLRSFRRQR